MERKLETAMEKVRRQTVVEMLHNSTLQKNHESLLTIEQTFVMQQSYT